MPSPMRRHFNYANIVATLALLFAMSGGALAATHYLITSTKQIKPSVFKALKGANGKNGASGSAGTPGAKGQAGPAGPAGPAGTNGTNGTEGKEGPPGKSGFTATLPAGDTETGSWSIGRYTSEDAVVFVALSFSIPLAAPLDGPHVHFVRLGGGNPTGCPGSSENPVAEKGYLCIYSNTESTGSEEIGIEGIFNPAKQVSTEGAGESGAVIAAHVPESGQAYGTWAVNGPE
jgi:hypothetical protein